MNDFVIYVNGARLENFTEAKISRSKGELTGTLTFTLFCSYVPGAPVLTNVLCGSQIVAYVGGNLAFVGSVDKRRGTGARTGASGTSETGSGENGESSASVTGNVSIGPDQYTLQVTCRGKTKQLVDSSQTHQTGTMLKPTTRQVIDELISNSGVGVEWLATDITLDKAVFRDGIKIVDELHRIGNENAYFIYENRVGELRVTDDTARRMGDNLILGQNILSFSGEMSEDRSRAEIRVKGQRTDKETWGEAAVIGTERTVTDSQSTNKAVVTLQHYGDGTPEALERRANFEANKRNAASREVMIEVFGVQAQGEPWDIGLIHYVEVPPEGIFDPMECTGLEYTVDAEKTLKTTITLSPVPSSGISGGVSAGGGFDLPGLAELVMTGAARKGIARAGVQGDFPVSWSGPSLSISDPASSVFSAVKLVDRLLGLTKDEDEKPPITLNLSVGGRGRT